MHHPTDRITHTTAFVTPVVEHWPEREIAQWVCNREYRNRRNNMDIFCCDCFDIESQDVVVIGNDF